MIRALWTSASGMIAQQMNLDVTSNNLANVNTTGFKKNRAEFEDLMYQNMKIAGTPNQEGNRLPVGLQIGMGVRPVAVHKIFTQGDFQNTGSQLDLVIEGEGFFVLIATERKPTPAMAPLSWIMKGGLSQTMAIPCSRNLSFPRKHKISSLQKTGT